jgi:hypothetical protein
MREVVMRIAPASIATASAAAESEAPAAAQPGPAESAIRAFLSGETDGAALLHELYDEVLDEPVPASMLAIVRAAG